MANDSATRHSLALRALILLGLVAFSAFLATSTGLLGTALDSDRSYISYVILLLYLAATAQWLFLSVRLSAERNRLDLLEKVDVSEGLAVLERQGRSTLVVGQGDACEEWPNGDLSRHFGSLLAKRDSGSLEGEQTALMTVFGDTLANRHSLGHFTSDVLLKLGLLGTMVGFILMLAPVARMSSLEAGQARDLLQAMSGGMSVALYTTIAGLVTSTLLKLQYQVIDSAGQDFINRVAVVTDALVSNHLRDARTPEAWPREVTE